MPQSLRKLFKLANPKPVYPASPVPSHGRDNKGSCPQFPLLPLPHDPTWCFPACPQMLCAPPIEICEYNNLSF